MTFTDKLVIAGLAFKEFCVVMLICCGIIGVLFWLTLLPSLGLLWLFGVI